MQSSLFQHETLGLCFLNKKLHICLTWLTENVQLQKMLLYPSNNAIL